MIAGFVAQEILTERKYDSFDTPPNRFVKFALQTFRGICEDVIHATIRNADTGQILVLNRERGAAWQEAMQMRDALDAFLGASLFVEIGTLRRIPIEARRFRSVRAIVKSCTLGSCLKSPRKLIGRGAMMPMTEQTATSRPSMSSGSTSS
jgi:hypothetical protein